MTRILTFFILALALLGLLFFIRNHDSVEHSSRSLPGIPTSQWPEFVAPDKKFSINFPAHPYHVVDSVKDPEAKMNRHYELYIATKPDGSMYSLNLISFPEEDLKTKSDHFLEGLISEKLSKNPNNLIKSLDLTTFRNNKAVDFVVENGQIIINGKAFIRGNTVYMFSQTTTNEKQNKDEFQFFVDSFKIPNSE
jgi:hypothetical protein